MTICTTVYAYLSPTYQQTLTFLLVNFSLKLLTKIKVEYQDF
jgi:hypothetical protein